MNLATRLTALERHCMPAEPELIIIKGGFHAHDPREATIAGERLECGEGEPIATFHARCRAAGKAAGLTHVVLGGLPD